MQRWQDELTKHPINTTLKQFVDVMEAEISITDPFLEVERTRFSKLTELLRDTIKKIDPDLAPIDLLSQLNNQFQTHGATQTAKNLSRGKDPSLFRELNDQINPSLSYIMQLRSAVIEKDSIEADREAASLSLEKFSHDVARRLFDFEKYLETIQVKFTQAEEIIKETLEKLDLDSKNFDENMNRWNAEATEAISTNRQQLGETLTKIKNQAKEKLTAFYAEQDVEAALKQEALENQLKDILTDSKSKHEEILSLYGLVAHDSVTGGHKNIADREYKAAQTWRRATIGCIIATAIWLWYSLFYITPIVEPESVFWLQIGKSISLTALLVSFAVYASKQAALHRVNERKARSFFLQVQAFDPFIANLPEEKRVELKQALSARIFGSDESELEKAMLENGDFKSLERSVAFVQKLKNLLGRQ